MWNAWLDKATGELVQSYTMLTVNADAHPIMRRMHKPDPELPADAQDKRSVIPIADIAVDEWLYGSSTEAASLLRLPPEVIFDAAPIEGEPPRQASLPF